MDICDRRVFAIRGATTVEHDDPAEIDKAVGELMDIIYRENGLDGSEVVFTLLSMTPDLKSRNAAAAVRKNGYSERSPLFCVAEADITGMLERCIRVMIEIEKPGFKEARMIYLRGASKLRPDLAVRK